MKSDYVHDKLSMLNNQEYGRIILNIAVEQWFLTCGLQSKVRLQRTFWWIMNILSKVVVLIDEFGHT